jgi:hypothetical protein
MSADKVLLVSFPKSGSNWVRYCVEHFSGRRTPGKARRNVLVSAGPTVFDRMHFVDKRHRNLFMRARARRGLEDYEHEDKTGLHGWLSTWRKERRVRAVERRRLLLLLRSHYESFGRNRLSAPEEMTGYLGNIQVFEACRRDKLLIYYHDLVSDLATIGRILDFLEIPHDFTGFDVEQHRRRSLELYARGPDQPESRDALLDFAYHSRGLSAETRQALKAYCQSYLGPELYERYLGGFDRLSEGHAGAVDGAIQPTIGRGRTS